MALVETPSGASGGAGGAGRAGMTMRAVGKSPGSNSKAARIASVLPADLPAVHAVVQRVLVKKVFVRAEISILSAKVGELK